MNKGGVCLGNIYDPYYLHFSSIYSTLPKDGWNLFCFQSIGDTYVVGALLKAFSERLRKRNEVTKLYVYTAPSHVPVMELFNEYFFKVYSINPKEINLHALARYSMFAPGFPIIAHPYYLDDGRIANFIGYKGITSVDVFKYALHLPLDSSLSRPKVADYNIEKANSFWQSTGLPTGKTAVLAPNAQTVPMLPNDFWSRIAKALNERGWTVCTNSLDGSSIEGTCPLKFDLGMAIPICEKAGLVVSLRSGFCDLISTASCRLIVLNNSEVKVELSDIVLEGENLSAAMGLVAGGLAEREEAYSINPNSWNHELARILESIEVVNKG